MVFSFTDPMVYIPVLVSIIAIAGYYYWERLNLWFRHIKKEPTETKDEVEEGEILCRIADNITARIGNENITQVQADEIIKEHNTLGRQWFRDGKRIYGLNRYENEKGEIKLRPIIVPSQITNSPSQLHNDMQQPEIAIIMTELMRDEDKPFIQKYGQILWWIAIMGFLAFMWSQS